LNNLQQGVTQLLSGKAAESLTGIKRGIEKEALRICPNGKLAQSPHPASLGSALTHPSITTDFSEALLEFITPPCDSIEEALKCLDNIHGYTYKKLKDNNEKLWVTSMPCILQGSDQIPVATYGSSNVAKMKYVYRLGLSHRYGRVMQTISGIHYNFSLPDTFWEILKKQEGSEESLQAFKTRRYFDLIRNYRRYFWLLLYLFGAAPAVCKTFTKEGVKHDLQTFADHSLYQPYATSLRMGNLGYQSESQAEMHVNYNSLDEYLHSLLKGLTTISSEYEKIGVCENGEYKQLNANILQIENEFYSTIRPKRVGGSGETPIKSLFDGGVEYIEVRSVDVDPFSPIGIDAQQASFIEVFLLFCLLDESQATDEEEYKQIYWNQHQVVANGRDPEQEIYCHGNKINLRDCAGKIFSGMEQVLDLFGEFADFEQYKEAFESQKVKLADASLTPAGKILALMEEEEISFYRFAMQQSEAYQDYFLEKEYDKALFAEYERAAAKSIEEQKKIEESDQISFAEHLQNYYQQYCDIAHKL